MAIKLIIKNDLEDGLYVNVRELPGKMVVNRMRRIKPYDEEKWKDGSVYEFNTLKEVREFIDSCDIDFTDEYAERSFSQWSWEEIDIDYEIGKEEDNLIYLYIGTHDEWRD